jgi:hypothetical protein
LLIDSRVVYLHAGVPGGSRRAALHAVHADEESGEKVRERREDSPKSKLTSQHYSAHHLISNAQIVSIYDCAID